MSPASLMLTFMVSYSGTEERAPPRLSRSRISLLFGETNAIPQSFNFFKSLLRMTTAYQHQIFCAKFRNLDGRLLSRIFEESETKRAWREAADLSVSASKLFATWSVRHTWIVP